MTLDVVTVNPTNSPSSTTISTTAKTIPVSVTVSLTLSCSRFRCASGGIRSLLLQQTDQQGIEHQLGAFLQRPPCHPVVITLSDVQRDNAVRTSPQGLRQQVSVVQSVAKRAHLHSLGDRHSEKLVGIFFRIALAGERGLRLQNRRMRR